MRRWVFALLLVARTGAAETSSTDGTDRVVGGPVPISTCLTTADYEALAALRASLPRIARPESPTVTGYADPMGGGGIDSFGKTVVNYVDLDPSGGLLDYNCGATTYDGHQGIDIEILSFYDMDEGVPVRCAAPGTVVAAHDGEFDRQTAWLSGVAANYVVVQHADGSLAYYYHFRKGSVAVSNGQPVSTGDTLGMVGSSGFSTGPHLHFETWNGATIDPFTGTCQGGPTWWASQPANVWTLPSVAMDHGLTTLGQQLTWPIILEKPPNKWHFKGGTSPSVKAWVRLRNVVTTDLIAFNFYRNSVLQAGPSPFSPSGNWSSAWFWGAKAISASATGVWRVDILRNGALMAQDYITVDGISNVAATIARKVFQVAVDTPVDDQFVGVDPDGEVYWYRIATPPLHGTLDQSGGRARKFHYTPDAGYMGLDSVGVYTLDDENLTGPTSFYVFEVGGPLAVSAAPASGLRLRAPQPNPMLRGGDFAYALPAATRTRLVLRDVGGRLVRLLDEGERTAGEHHVHWDGRGADGRAAPAGIYFATLETPEGIETRRVVSVR